MHELSIALALMDLVKRHTPVGVVVTRVAVCAGPLRAIEPDAMQHAWRAATADSGCRGAELQLRSLPWQLHCPQCDREWDSDDPLAVCSCGCDKSAVSASNELTLLELDVEGAPTPTGDIQSNARVLAREM